MSGPTPSNQSNNQPNQPDSQQELLAGYVLYNLSPEEAAAVEQWMDADPAVTQDVEHLQRMLEQAYAPLEAQPPSRLRQSLLQRYETAQSPSNADAPTAPERPGGAAPSNVVRIDRRWLGGLGALAALVILGLGINNYILWRSLQIIQAQTQSDELTEELVTVSLAPVEGNVVPGAVTVLIDPDDLEATLDTALPPLPEGQVYALWTVLQPEAPFTTDDKDAILTHVFSGEGQDGLSETIALPPVYQDSRWIRAIAVTVEDADAPQRHDAGPILIETL